MRKLGLVAFLVSVLPVLAFAQGGGAAPPAPPPEQKKTVDAFLGTWTFEGTVSGIPGTKEPIKLKETFVCKKAAGGLVAACFGNANIPGMGKVEDVLLITYDVEGKAVRVVGMSSMGEVHDHKCAWKDDKSVTCDPLSIVAGGAPATVDLVMSWPDAKTVAVTETTKMKDGSKVVFDGKGKRK